MEDRSNLDEYLAGLGITNDDEKGQTTPLQNLQTSREYTEQTSVSTAQHNAKHIEQNSQHGEQGQDEEQDEKAILENFFHGFIDRINPEFRLNITTQDDTILVTINGDGAERLAGRYGNNLHAIELLAYTVINKKVGRSHWRVRVDAGGVRRRHDHNLGELAERIAIKVAKNGEPHELQPMPAADRRVVHITLKDHPDVRTESIGEGDSRRLIVKPRHMP